jgi:hypothetical protein
MKKALFTMMEAMNEPIPCATRFCENNNKILATAEIKVTVPSRIEMKNKSISNGNNDNDFASAPFIKRSINGKIAPMLISSRNETNTDSASNNSSFTFLERSNKPKTYEELFTKGSLEALAALDWIATRTQ